MNLGLAAHALGEYPKAINYYNHSMEIAQRIGDKEEQCYMNLGIAADDLGEYPVAIYYHNQALRNSQEDRRRSIGAGMFCKSWLNSTCTWRIPQSHRLPQSSL